MTRWGLQIVPPNTPGIQRPKLCKGNCGPDGGVWLNSRPDRWGLQWKPKCLATGELASLAKHRTKTQRRFSAHSLEPSTSTCPSCWTCSLLALGNATASCSWRTPGKNPACLVFLNLLAGCTSWLIHKAESLPTSITLLGRRKVCAY